MSKSMKKVYDVIVIGAGPAGSEIAYRLAKAGFEVLVLEKDLLNREKPCGGGLQVSEIAEFGLPPAAVIERRIHNARLISPENNLLEIGVSDTAMYSVTVRRSKYDQYLQERANEVGASFRAQTKVTHIRRSGEKIYIYTNREEKPLTARLVINAGGAFATKLTGRQKIDAEKQKQSVTRHYWLKLPSMPESLADFIEFYYLKELPEGYAWIFPYQNVVSVGIGDTLQSLKKEDINLKRVLDDFITHHPIAAGKLQGHTIVHKAGGIIPVTIPAALHGTSTLLLGDAAGLANIIHGGGIYHARKSAVIASEYCERFLQTGNQKFLKQGGEAIKTFFTNNEKRWDKRLQQIFWNHKIIEPIIIKGQTDKDIQKALRITTDSSQSHKKAYDLLEKKMIELIYSGLAEKAEIYKPVFNEKISKIFDQNVPIHKYANQILLSKKAKRLRAYLGILAADIFGGDLSDAANFSLVYEIFHTASLIHDDIMDNSSKRRGKTTLHTKYGVSNAIIVGDLMLAKGYTLVAEFCRKKSISKTQLLDLLDIIGQTGEKCCIGQALDITMATKHQYGSINNYLKMIELKTGALIEGAVKGGAVGAKASRKQVDLMGSFGLNLGIAFQIIDDAFDLLGGKKANKSIMSDIKEGKATPMLIWSLKKADNDESAWLREMAGNTSITQKQATTVINIYRKYGALEYAQRLGHTYIERAKNILEKLPPVPARDQFMEIVEILDYWCMLAS
ncbi:MAG: geranylgeranyl reductase family protein [Xanthomonadaceae bacterium]|nr:geranylgeranyl reductase family protein [Xanthomonadaceae bacterium]